MQVKKYEAPSMNEALQLIKAELGSEAIILSTKNHRKGFGLLSKASVEVTAAVSEKSLAKKELMQETVNEPQYTAPAQKSAASGISGYARNGKVSVPPSETPPKQTSYGAVQDMELKTLQRDMGVLKGMLEEIKTEQAAQADTKIAEETTSNVQIEFQNLLHNGVDKKCAATLIKQVTFELPRDQHGDSDRITEALAVEMMRVLKVNDPLDFKAGVPQVIALVGPTGVGKTTTIAKLASQAILDKNLKVGLINVDSYKVAATDQLATYAKILNVPFRQASNAIELDRALAEFKRLDLVLIDTTGRSQRDAENLVQMKDLLADLPGLNTYLIMSATTRDQELYDIINRFKIFNPAGLMFSKLDESSTFGCIYNVAVKTKLPLTYFTVGQRVPEDIETASRERVAALILDL